MIESPLTRGKFLPLDIHGNMGFTANKALVDTQYRFRAKLKFALPPVNKQRYANFSLFDDFGHTFYIVPKYLLLMLQFADIKHGVVEGEWGFETYHTYTSLVYYGP